MQLKLPRVIFAAVVFAAVSPAAVLIDDFSASQALVIPPDTDPADSNVPTGATAIGGTRAIILDRTSGTAGSSVRIDTLVPGQLAFSNEAGTASELTIIWDGDNDTSLNPNGFTAVDLSEGGSSDRIRIRTSGDFALNATFTLWSSAGNVALWNFILPSAPADVDVDLIFSAPSNTFGSFDLSAVTAAQLEVIGVANSDRTIDFISANGENPIPEPMSLSLVGGALLLLGLRRTRRAR
jgi:hypothetical protein